MTRELSGAEAESVVGGFTLTQFPPVASILGTPWTGGMVPRLYGPSVAAATVQVAPAPQPQPTRSRFSNR